MLERITPFLAQRTLAFPASSKICVSAIQCNGNRGVFRFMRVAGVGIAQGMTQSLDDPQVVTIKDDQSPKQRVS